MPPRGVVRVPRRTDAGVPSGHARCGLGGMRVWWKKSTDAILLKYREFTICSLQSWGHFESGASR